MHELALAEGVLAVVLDAAQGQKVKEVHIHAGALQMVVADSFSFAFELLSENTPAQGANVVVESLPVHLKCKECSGDSEVFSQPFFCEKCNSPNIEVLSGMELIVDSVELDDGNLIQRKVVDMSEAMESHIREHHEHDR